MSTVPVIPPQPAYSPLWYGVVESGDTKRFVANGYVHIHCQLRGAGKSEGRYGDDPTDHYDMIDITCMDLATGTGGLTNIEYAAPHVCSSKTTLHKIYHNAEYPSHLLLPIIPED